MSMKILNKKILKKFSDFLKWPENVVVQVLPLITYYLLHGKHLTSEHKLELQINKDESSVPCQIVLSDSTENVCIHRSVFSHNFE